MHRISPAPSAKRREQSSSRGRQGGSRAGQRQRREEHRERSWQHRGQDTQSRGGAPSATASPPRARLCSRLLNSTASQPPGRVHSFPRPNARCSIAHSCPAPQPTGGGGGGGGVKVQGPQRPISIGFSFDRLEINPTGMVRPCTPAVCSTLPGSHLVVLPAAREKCL